MGGERDVGMDDHARALELGGERRRDFQRAMGCVDRMCGDERGLQHDGDTVARARAAND